MEKEKLKEEKCNCGENCECGENCNCTEECTCGDDCNCTEEDNCGCGGICNHDKEDKKEKKAKKKKDKHEDKLNEAYNMISELEDKLLREKAELVNYRKRKEEETSRMLMYSNEDLAKSLLPIVDNFERAINMDDENLEDEVSKFLSGFKMIYCNLISTLEKYGVKAIDGANKPFLILLHLYVLSLLLDGM